LLFQDKPCRITARDANLARRAHLGLHGLCRTYVWLTARWREVHKYHVRALAGPKREPMTRILSPLSRHRGFNQLHTPDVTGTQAHCNAHIEKLGATPHEPYISPRDTCSLRDKATAAHDSPITPTIFASVAWWRLIMAFACLGSRTFQSATTGCSPVGCRIAAHALAYVCFHPVRSRSTIG